VTTLDPVAGFRLDGKVAVVTGASSGLGARFARVLDAAGARVVLAARRIDRLEALANELGDAVTVECDLAQPHAPAAIVDAALEQCERVDVLVNNAGAWDEIPAIDFPVDRFREIVEINLVAPFALSQCAARAMIDTSGGGSIINVASQYGLVGVKAGIAGYAASKGGLVNLTRQLAAEWARAGVRVNALAPGYFPSEMTSGLFDSDASLGWIARTSPMGRPGEEHELDGALLFLAGDASSYVTGSVLSVDGGWTAV
jgi:NAD(P)-dependent dehydrogenase (short-subunit alcohol dehydrogenase family)